MEYNSTFNAGMFDIFFSEWVESKLAWEDFITLKDLGLEYIRGRGEDEQYSIVDIKKWMMAKIKYGI